MTAHRYEVQLVNPATGKPKTFSTHDTREAADLEAAKLRAHRMFAQVRRVDDEPEHRGDRRRFLVAMVMGGFVRPERMTERIVAEIERDTP